MPPLSAMGLNLSCYIEWKVIWRTIAMSVSDWVCIIQTCIKSTEVIRFLRIKHFTINAELIFSQKLLLLPLNVSKQQITSNYNCYGQYPA